MDSPDLVIQMFLYILALLLSPAIQKYPHVMAVRAAEAPVFITPLILPLKRIDTVFLLMKLLSRQRPHRLRAVQIIARIHLLLYQVASLRQIQVLDGKFIRQINDERISQLLIKIGLNRLKRRRQILLPAERHGGKTLSIVFHQPQKRLIFPDRVTNMIIFLPDKALHKYAVTRPVMPHIIIRQHFLDTADRDLLKLQFHKSS